MLTVNNFIDVYKEEINALIEEYGSASHIPSDERHLASEKLRAGYCLSTNLTSNPLDVFRLYSVDQRVWGFYLSDVPEDVSSISRKPKRTDKYQSIIDWTEEHLLEQITPNDIMSVGDISYPTALKFINDRPDLFRKVKRGLYEVRDVKTERANAI